MGYYFYSPDDDLSETEVFLAKSSKDAATVKEKTSLVVSLAEGGLANLPRLIKAIEVSPLHR